MEKPKRKNNNKNKYYNTQNYNSNNINNTQNYNIPINFQNLPILYTPFSSNNFPFMPFGLNVYNPINNIQNYNNNIYTKNNKYSNKNSLEITTQESSSEDKNYYGNFGENYYDSLQKGLKDISELYNYNKYSRPKISLLCHYYCNLDINKDDEEYINNEIQKLGDNLKKIMKINSNDELEK